MKPTEVDEGVAGSPEVSGAKNRSAFERSIHRSCRCPLELREERGGLRCARCDAPIFARRSA